MARDRQTAATSHRWQRRFFRWGIRNISYRWWIKPRIEGWQNIPAENPVVIMGNHIGAADPGVMISLYPGRDIVPIAKIESFEQPIMRFFVRHWGAIPVNRGEADIKALKSAFDELDRGNVVMLYAEGHRSKTGLILGQEGSAYIALKSDAYVVPAAIWGSRDFPGAWLREFKPTEITMRFGRPFRFRHEGGKLPREHFRAMTDEAMYQIAMLLPAEWRGIYSDLSKATTHFLDFDIQWTPIAPPLPTHFLGSGSLPTEARFASPEAV